MTIRKNACLVVLLCTMPIVAHAARALPAPSEATTAQQCSACHMAYPAQMLPARSWLALMSDLSHHFGEDASLSDQDRAAVTAYLTTHAADGLAAGREGQRFLRGLSPAATPLKITDTPWWRRRHSEISPSRFHDPRVKTAANCGACHNGRRGVVWGLFDED
jgi:mono/diheme cytochrome c family protein